MEHNAEVSESIARRDTSKILEIFFQGKPPQLRDAFKFESDLWDFKASCPGHGESHKYSWAEIAADVLAFHNTRGGIIFFGIADQSFSFCGTTSPIDSKLFTDKIRRYCGDKIFVSYCRAFQESGGRHLGMAIIPRRGLNVVPFFCDAPAKGDKNYFRAGDIAVRRNDETQIYRGDKASEYLAEAKIPSSSAQFVVDEPSFKIIRPGWEDFVFRPTLCKSVQAALRDERTFVTSLTGLGGVGKTALACWAAIDAYENNLFDYIISTSAKDRELTTGGISEVAPIGSTLGHLLDSTLQTVGFSEACTLPPTEKRKFVTELIKGTRLLYFVDNLETVQDADLIDFLENLPLPVKALLTSRKSRVQRAVYPIEISAFEKVEALAFLDSVASRRGRDYLVGLRNHEKDLIIESCYRVPLVIEWFVGLARDEVSAIELARELERSPRRSDEVLEFSFRRVHTELTGDARKILNALSMFSSPQPIEAISAACQLSLERVDVGLDELTEASLLIRNFDRRLNDTAFGLLPITQRFAYSELRKEPGLETDIRRAIREWYEGRDIQDAERRRTIISIRQGRSEIDTLLVDAAKQLRQSGKMSQAEDFFVQATQRNPRSWRAFRELGDFYKQERKTTLALDCYRKATSLAPKSGKDRALIFREYGILLRDGVESDSLEKASGALETALKETPNDPVCIFVLGQVYCRREMHRRAEPLLERIVAEQDVQGRLKAYPLLKRCYDSSGEIVKLAELRAKAARDGARI